jgi:hypothetical protein
MNLDCGNFSRFGQPLATQKLPEGRRRYEKLVSSDFYGCGEISRMGIR